MTNNTLERKMLLVELIAFVMVVALIWFDEVADLPHYLFGAARTPVNWSESLFETVVVSVIACVIALLTRRVLKRVKYLEGLLSICSFCKKIRVGDRWEPVEQYIGERTDADFTNSLCPDCLFEHYGPIVGEKVMAIRQKANRVD
jgi:hypothetical protein